MLKRTAMHYRAISYVNLPRTYDDAILAQFVVHHGTFSNRTIRVITLVKCRFAVGQLSVNCWYSAADSWPTAHQQSFRGAVLHFLHKLNPDAPMLRCNLFLFP